MAESQQRFYKEDEAEQILRLASNISSPAAGMSRDRLLETAAELGISPESVELAERQLQVSRLEQSDRAEFDRRIRRDFYSHLASYVIVNGGLCAINLATGGYFWAIWPMLGWGIGLAFSVFETFFRSSEGYHEEFEKWRAKRGRMDALKGSSQAAVDLLLEGFFQRRADRGNRAGKLEAIKYIREKTGLDLVEAKEVVESFAARNPGMFV
ncbi:MAG: 2TM domain-containing protein [Fimbriimonas sp.]|nr:2TM domain-containing protein [Fimbriimonas sp.]